MDQKEKLLKQLIFNYPKMKGVKDDIQRAAALLARCYQNGHKLLVCGNGGSAADSGHIVGELMKGFCLKRPLSSGLKEKLEEAFGEEGRLLGSRLQEALPAISLNSHQALISAFANDAEPDYVYAQQLMGYGEPGDVLIGISTSGNAENVIAAMQLASVLGLDTIALSGKDGGVMAGLADEAIIIPEDETYRIQEYHIAVYHYLCRYQELTFFEE